MNRRTFVGTAAAGAAAWAAGARAAGGDAARQLIELRTYAFASEEKLGAFAKFLADAFVPALNRCGIRPVGAFRMRKADNPKTPMEADPLSALVLLPHADAASVLGLPERLDADAAYAAAAKAVLGTPMKDPVYARYETQLMRAFVECPSVSAPAKGDNRVLQLRIYESHNEERALRKIAMFNEGGEIALFRRLGLNPVFFGQSLAGTRLPNLTYMLGFDSPAKQEAAWAAFQKDPEWIKLKADPKYADTVSNITNQVLRPLPGSQI